MGETQIGSEATSFSKGRSNYGWVAPICMPGIEPFYLRNCISIASQASATPFSARTIFATCSVLLK